MTLKRSLPLLAVIFLSCLSCSDTLFIECNNEPIFNPSSQLSETVERNRDKKFYYSQCDEGFDREFAPIKVSRTQAINNFPDRKEDLGTESVFISRENALKLISGKNVKGLRLYLADNDNDPDSRGIIAVGAKRKRSDKAPLLSKRYYYTSKMTGQPTRLNITQAATYIENVSRDDRYSAFFDKESINYLLTDSKWTGLVIMPGKLFFDEFGGNVGYTFFVGTSDHGSGGSDQIQSLNKLETFQDQTEAIFIGSKMPCPPDCDPPTPKLPNEW